MPRIPTDALLEDSIECPLCGDMVPRGHTVLRGDQTRVCWFCHTDERMDSDPTDDDEAWDDEEDWDDWD